MVNASGPAGEAGPLILLRNSNHAPGMVNTQRVITRRGGCCRRPGIGAGGVGGPNSRSKNDGPEKPELSLAKLTPAGRLPTGCE